MALSALRSQVESALAGRVLAPFSNRPVQVETMPFHIPELDDLTGGLPRGGLTEIFGPDGSGRATLFTSALVSATMHSEACAIVDGRDSLDPLSAESAGVKLDQLLWVRCRNLDQCLRATDLLLQGGGFGLIAVDLSLLAPKAIRYVPLNVWFRFRRTIENTSTILLLLGQESNAGSCASLVLQLRFASSRWLKSMEQQAPLAVNSCACLLDGSQIHVELIRSRLKSAAAIYNSGKRLHSADSTVSFRTKAKWRSK